jgi:hypothetical protein
VLSQFLRSSGADGDWPLNKERRRHIHDAIDSARLSVLHTAFRHGGLMFCSCAKPDRCSRANVPINRVRGKSSTHTTRRALTLLAEVHRLSTRSRHGPKGSVRAALSSATHHAGYELAPTVDDFREWQAAVERVVGGNRATDGGGEHGGQCA